jgi:hypothetical protein
MEVKTVYLDNGQDVLFSSEEKKCIMETIEYHKESFSDKDKQYLFERLNCLKENFLKMTSEELFQDFMNWLCEIRQIKPNDIEKPDRQKVVDQYMNSERGQRCLLILPHIFFHSLPDTMQCDFLALRELPGSINQEFKWIIKRSYHKDKPYDHHEAVYNLGYDTMKYFYEKLNFFKSAKSVTSPSDILFRYANWLEEVKSVDPTKLKGDERQMIVDKYLNSLEGHFYIGYLLSGAAYHYWPEISKCDLLALMSCPNCLDIDTDWEIKLKYLKDNIDRYEVVTKNYK